MIRYAFLWRWEYERGQEEGVKERPCAVMTAVGDDEGRTFVTVVPVTHTPPGAAALAVEIPYATKQRLGLDDERSWVVLTEANRFEWPGPDVRMKEPERMPESVAYGLLPRSLFREIRARFADAIEGRRALILRRTQ